MVDGGLLLLTVGRDGSLYLYFFLFFYKCILLQETTYANTQLYAKIGCMERETFTSTKLALHLYTDTQCSEPYDDGYPSRRHSTTGYEIKGYTFSTRVSFRPPFYTCQTCKPDEISDTFNKKSNTWYDDDYISEHGSKQGDDENDEEEEGDDKNNNNKNGDDYFQDDAYLSANDDVNYDDYYNRKLSETGTESKALSLRVESRLRELTPAVGQLEVSIFRYADRRLPCSILAGPHPL
jgi:hypothetical protein